MDRWHPSGWHPSKVDFGPSGIPSKVDFCGPSKVDFGSSGRLLHPPKPLRHHLLPIVENGRELSLHEQTVCDGSQRAQGKLVSNLVTNLRTAGNRAKGVMMVPVLVRPFAL